MSVKILYGSETGNAESLANKTQKELNEKGINAEVKDMSNISLKDLKEYKTILIITSTWGDGDAPTNAMDLLDELKAAGEEALSSLNYAVFGIGESFYEHFCQAASDFDKELERLGAKRLLDTVKSEDYDEDLSGWIEKLIPNLK